MQQSLPQNNQGDPELPTESMDSSKTRVATSLENSQTTEMRSFHPGPSVRSTGTEDFMKLKATQNQWWESVPPIRQIVDFVKNHLPTLYNASPRLPFALVPFAFSQFILIEALSGQGWIDIFARWLVLATKEQMYPTLWIIRYTLPSSGVGGLNNPGLPRFGSSTVGGEGTIR